MKGVLRLAGISAAEQRRSLAEMRGVAEQRSVEEQRSVAERRGVEEPKVETKVETKSMEEITTRSDIPPTRKQLEDFLDTHFLLGVAVRDVDRFNWYSIGNPDIVALMKDVSESYKDMNKTITPIIEYLEYLAEANEFGVSKEGSEESEKELEVECVWKKG